MIIGNKSKKGVSTVGSYTISYTVNEDGNGNPIEMIGVITSNGTDIGYYNYKPQGMTGFTIVRTSIVSLNDMKALSDQVILDTGQIFESETIEEG